MVEISNGERIIKRYHSVNLRDLFSSDTAMHTVFVFYRALVCVTEVSSFVLVLSSREMNGQALFVITAFALFVSGHGAVNIFNYANVQYTILYYQYRDLSFQSYPFYGNPTQTEWVSLPILHSFTNGFFSGIFWNLLEVNATENMLKMANDLMIPTAPVANMTDTHDVGFVIMAGFGHAYRLLKRPGYLEVIITAANSLSTRYSPIVRCTRSWDSKEGFLVIIDNMMNLELLFEASYQTKNRTWYNLAWQHANRTMYEHFRADNSTYHVVEYNESDGSVIRKYTAQGKVTKS